MMRDAQHRVDVTAGNVTNMATPGYRAQRVFSQVFDLRQALPEAVVEEVVGDRSALKSTGNPLDIATDSGTVLRLRSADGYVQSRSAQLHQDGDGLLIDGQGRVLQAEGGGDLNIGSGTPQILKDGTVLVAGQAVGKIGLFDAIDAQDSAVARAARGHGGAGHGAGRAHAGGAAEVGTIHTGMLVSADVDLGAEMVELTKASRQAETGSRVFSVYDDLLGAATSKLGDLGK
jgi:flagellar basal-body rod protein FlgF